MEKDGALSYVQVLLANPHTIVIVAPQITNSRFNDIL